MRDSYGKVISKKNAWLSEVRKVAIRKKKKKEKYYFVTEQRQKTTRKSYIYYIFDLYTQSYDRRSLHHCNVKLDDW